MRENGVDPYELIGEAKVDGIAPIKEYKIKLSKKQKLKDLLKL